MKREMEAYIVLLHLVSQGWAKFADIRDQLGWDFFKIVHDESLQHSLKNMMLDSGSWCSGGLNVSEKVSET